MNRAVRATREAALVLSDGELFEGEAIGAEAGRASGEVVFNTALTGYQEVITDPSYAGQIITFTYPHIGNYGTNEADSEAARPHCRGVIVRDLARRPSNWRSRRLPKGRALMGRKWSSPAPMWERSNWPKGPCAPGSTSCWMRQGSPPRT